MFYSCTYFDRNYLSRGLALYGSLREHCPSFRLWVLCLDDDAYQALSTLRLPEIELIALRDFEDGDEQLLVAKQNRSRVEYYFTCTPSLLLYIFSRWGEVDLLTYLDADLYFFSSPEPIFDEIGQKSIAIIGHRFPEKLQGLEDYGIYNVGWTSFRRGDEGLACLRWWREKCVDWCYDRVDEGRFADQGYLNEFPARFKNVAVLAHIGANLAPWNLANYKLRATTRGDVTVNNRPLVFFHFHGLKKIRAFVYDPQLRRYYVATSRLIRVSLYRPYVRAMNCWERKVLSTYGRAPQQSNIRYGTGHQEQPSTRGAPIGHALVEWVRTVANTVRGHYLLCFK